MSAARARKETMDTLAERITRAAVLAAALLGAACAGGGESGGPEAPATYEELLSAGWAAFASEDYPLAAAAFAGAASLADSLAEPRAGLGWTRLYLAEPAEARQTFEEGAGLAGAAGILADLYAGWAFAENALKDPAGADLGNFTGSNARIAAALEREPGWTFDRRPSLAADDLHLLRAANHFALGQFAESLAAVREVDAAFDAEVDTPAGRAELAARVEELTSQSF